MDECRHTSDIKDVTPSALGCEECLKSGSEWLHLRICRTCGHANATAFEAFFPVPCAGRPRPGV